MSSKFFIFAYLNMHIRFAPLLGLHDQITPSINQIKQYFNFNFFFLTYNTKISLRNSFFITSNSVV